MDNAATSFPKPREVAGQMARFAAELGASAGRGAYAEAAEVGGIVAECRGRVARIINAPAPECVAFTANCSDALNTAIKGLIDPRRGGHVVCTETDHNSILRPITAMDDDGWCEFTRVRVDGRGFVDPDDVRRAIRPDTRLVAMTHASNVTGAVQDAAAVGRVCREMAVPFVLDAAQSVGHLPIDVQDLPVDLLAAPGHKALLGPLGTGFLYLRPGMERMVRPLRHGGTGSRSDEPRHPDTLPDKYEAGSHNAIGLVGLNEGCRWVERETVDALHRRAREQVRTFIENVLQLDGFHYYGPQGVADRIGVFSVRVDGLSPGELSAKLEGDYGILTRSGMHCAPLVHRRIGSFELGGTARLSFGPFLSNPDVKYAADALAEMAMDRAATPA